MNESDRYQSMMIFDRILIDEWKEAHVKGKLKEARAAITVEQKYRINEILDFIKFGTCLYHRAIPNKGGLFDLKLTKLIG